MSNPAPIVFALLAAGAGACLAFQAGANGRFRTNLDNPIWATFFSICGTTLTAAVAMLVLRPPPPEWDAVRNTEWWNWIGGTLGALIVLAGATLTRELGAATFVALVVAGQLVTALLLDNFGLMALEVKPLTLGRVAGAALVVAGVLAIKYL